MLLGRGVEALRETWSFLHKGREIQTEKYDLLFEMLEMDDRVVGRLCTNRERETDRRI